jgi:hypothetical protein
MYKFFLLSLLFILFAGCGTEESVPTPSSIYNSCIITLELPSYFTDYYTNPSPGTTKNTVDFVTIRSTYQIINNGIQICPMWQSKNIAMCADSSIGDSLSLLFSFSSILDTNSKMLREIVFHSEGYDSSQATESPYSKRVHKHSIDLLLFDQPYMNTDNGITIILKDSLAISAIKSFESESDSKEEYYYSPDVRMGFQYWRSRFEKFSYPDSNTLIRINIY